MRIALVTDHGLPPESFGGIPQYVYETAQVTTQLGHHVEVFTPMMGVHDYPFPVRRVKPCGTLWDGYVSAAVVYPMVYRRLLKALRERADSFDILHGHNPFMSGRAVSKVARETGIPSILSFHFSATGTAFLQNQGPLLAERVARWGVGGHQRVLVHSQGMKRAVSQRFGIDSAKIDVLPLAVDTETFRPGCDCSWVRKSFNIPDGAPLLLFLGAMRKLKGPHVLLEAFSRLPDRDPYLLLAGGGPFLEEAQALSRQLRIDDRVRFLGAVSGKDLPALYCASAVFVYPGLDECYSLVVLEAAACGRPIIGTDHTIMLEEFSEGGRVAAIHHRGDPDSLAAAISALLRDPARRNEMGQHAREKVLARHSFPKYAAGLIAYWENCRKEYRSA